MTKEQSDKHNPKHRLAAGASREFHAACERAAIPPTQRQWMKFRRGIGQAYAASK